MPLKEQPEEPSPNAVKRAAGRTVPDGCSDLIKINIKSKKDRI